MHIIESIDREIMVLLVIPRNDVFSLLHQGPESVTASVQVSTIDRHCDDTNGSNALR